MPGKASRRSSSPSTRSWSRPAPTTSSTTCARPSPERARTIGRAARQRVLRDHTYSRRAAELDQLCWPNERGRTSDDAPAGGLWSQPELVVGQWARDSVPWPVPRARRARLADHLLRARRRVVSQQPRPDRARVLRPHASTTAGRRPKPLFEPPTPCWSARTYPMRPRIIDWLAGMRSAAVLLRHRYAHHADQPATVRRRQPTCVPTRSRCSRCIFRSLAARRCASSRRAGMRAARRRCTAGSTRWCTTRWPLDPRFTCTLWVYGHLCRRSAGAPARSCSSRRPAARPHERFLLAGPAVSSDGPASPMFATRCTCIRAITPRSTRAIPRR